MFYHIQVEMPAVRTWFASLNASKDDALQQWICPFIMREPILQQDQLFNAPALGGLRVFTTERAITTDWPVKWEQAEGEGEGEIERQWSTFQKNAKYWEGVTNWISQNGISVTKELVREALVLTESGAWQARLKKRFEQQKGRSCFFICPFGNAEVDHNYRVLSASLRSRDGGLTLGSFAATGRGC